MASRILSTALRPATSFAVSRQAVVAQRNFSGSATIMKQKEDSGKLLVQSNISRRF
jgi:hypothetical protein